MSRLGKKRTFVNRKARRNAKRLDFDAKCNHMCNTTQVGLSYDSRKEVQKAFIILGILDLL